VPIWVPCWCDNRLLIYCTRGRSRIGELAMRHRLPSMCEEISYVREGCLLSYGPDFGAMWRHSAAYVDKILKGASPGDLPIEQPTNSICSSI
jgi:putative ABC transport system substrate-binding protein